jgi:peptidoglycan/LPS O-acetylase OafA/YrhL
MATIRYRADIDGLRAVAVCSVLLFHADLGILPGGFVGVDVFFVISGYLITSIILTELDRGQFSILNFYERRIRRIAPALAVVIAASIAIGWFVLTPDDYRRFGRSVIAAAAFYSNFYFNSRTGYFAPTAETQPLLHTWSLGVEEQFYLLAPGFLLLLVHTRLRPWRKHLFFGLLALSLAISANGVAEEHKSAFYLLPSRAFELMIGMALALGFVPPIRSSVMRHIAGVSGLVMIAAAALFYNSETPFPGLAAVVPCLGAALVIHSGSTEDTATYKLLAVRPIVFVGKLSYSLYLWHWPLLAFAAYDFGADLYLYHRMGLLALASILSVLSYFYIEQPVRQGKLLLTQLKVFSAGAAALLFFLGFTGAVHYFRGFPDRLGPEAAAFMHTYYDNSDRRFENESLLGSKNDIPPSFVLWGDSHAEMLMKQVSRLANDRALTGWGLWGPGCPPFFGLNEPQRSTFNKCLSLIEKAHERTQAPEITNVVLIARWAAYADAIDPAVGRFSFKLVPGDEQKNRAEFARLLRTTVEQLLATGRTVTLLGPVPELPFHLPRVMTQALMRGRQADFSVPYSDFLKRQETVLSVLAELDQLPGVRVLYPHLRLCDGDRCKTVEDGKPLYRDDDHLNAVGAEFLADLLREALTPEAPTQEVVGSVE